MRTRVQAALGRRYGRLRAVSRHRERHRERRRAEQNRTWRDRWHDRYPDPGFAETSGVGDIAAAFGFSWIARRWHDRKRRGSNS